MFIDLGRVPPEGQAIDRSLALEGPYVEGEEFRPLSPVSLTGWLEPIKEDGEEALRGEGFFRLRGRMSCRIELSCVRCLEPVPMEVAEDLDLLYLPQSANAAAGESGGNESEGLSDRGLAPEELAVSFYRDERIDLSQMAREQILLALPMKPLCKGDCRGLCPQCGANRNVQRCGCAPEDSDSRWAPLKMLQKSRRS